VFMCGYGLHSYKVLTVGAGFLWCHGGDFQLRFQLSDTECKELK
jgi:hypothetical protein